MAIHSDWVWDILDLGQWHHLRDLPVGCQPIMAVGAGGGQGS